MSVEAPGLASQVVWSASADRVRPGSDRYAWVSDDLGVIEPNRLFFAPVKDLGLGGHVDSVITPGPDGTAEVELRAHGFNT
ncbi:hypothetical protein L3Q65_24810 [Amycolatopsis sp. FU40]|uniref:hypothetical protein n=1 Tax=Amycolatopsis sp. FU40 TaxID=2914159 RepID=UPI001F163584|nr:hypothetical protein [Amycolatopsis sp. FU40]UKD51153.1 hypothetical protein L3Q65_24810 [Amycolatopsis sp. FU40]